MVFPRFFLAPIVPIASLFAAYELGFGLGHGGKPKWIRTKLEQRKKQVRDAASHTDTSRTLYLLMTNFPVCTARACVLEV